MARTMDFENGEPVAKRPDDADEEPDDQEDDEE